MHRGLPLSPPQKTCSPEKCLSRGVMLIFKPMSTRQILFLLLFAPLGLSAQSFGPNNTWLQGLGIRSIGPAGMSGRVTAIDVVRDNPSVIYIGTASGGLWKSESGGIAWEPVFDQQPTQSIGAVAIDPGNPSVIWAGTGEGNPRNTHNSGMGVFRSPDGGRTWQAMGLEQTRTIHRIIVHPRDPNTVYVGALGSAWGPHPERGVYRTRDGGKTWQLILHVNDSTGCADLIIDPSNPNKLMAAMWEYGRKPWFFTSGGKGSGLYATYDGGDTWRNLSQSKASGLPEGELGRIGLAIAPSRPRVVYAWVEAKENALFRSDDGGLTWTQRATQGIGNRPFYYASIYVDPQNENRVYSLYSMVSRSEDGGKSWEIIIPYSGVHPDHHALYIHPDNPELILNGNDGGLAISQDRGASWRFVENLPLGQFYHVSVDRERPYNIYGGLQDNGSWAGPAYAWQYGGLRNANWTEVLFGDGFDVQPHPANSRYGYAMWQGGNLAAYDKLSGQTRYIQPAHPQGDTLRFNWNAALALDPFDPKGLYYGSQYVHHSSDEGRSWRIISPDLTTDDTNKQRQVLSGGLTIDATTAENHTTLLCIAPSALEKGLIWAGSDDGRLHLTRDGGESWTDVYGRLPGAPRGGWIPQISPSTHEAGTVLVALNHYRRNDWQPYAYRSDDYGKTFKRIAGPDQIKGHVMTVIQDLREPDLLFLGTENGLWFSLNGGKAWEPWAKDFPAVPVSDLAIHPDEGDLVIGTFGRAIWVLDDLEPLRARARDARWLDRPFALSPAPDAVQAAWAQAPGVRFDADAGYRGANRPGGASITAWLHPNQFAEPKKTDEKPSGAASDSAAGGGDARKIRLHLLGPGGDTLRFWTVEADTGLLRFRWDLRERGPRYPSHDKPKKDADDPAGRYVLPGVYTLHAAWKNHRDSTRIRVLPDPRLEGTQPDNPALRQAQERHAKTQQMLTRAQDQLREALETLDRMSANQAELADSTRKNLDKEADSLRKRIQALQAFILTPKDFKGIDGEERLAEQIWKTGYLLSYPAAPAPNALAALDNLESRTRALLEQVNAFFEGEWAAYRERVESQPWTPFAKREKLLLE
jgi:photosystem II stability/assembly factor-like uncharacterized protein